VRDEALPETLRSRRATINTLLDANPGDTRRYEANVPCLRQLRNWLVYGLMRISRY
jgi:hypothetical protein